MSNQRLNFATLYQESKQAVEAALTSMWIGETLNASQKSYARQLKEIIRDIFAPKNAMPLVECINPYESVEPDNVPSAEALVGELWKKTMPENIYYPPYRHQAESWKTLQEYTPDGDPMSIVVTTGTGSGKTECFMLPLVNDLIKQKEAGHAGKVQAIFLYPLNALMDDQKERLEQLVVSTGLRYAVYNSNLAERDDPNNDEMQKKIRLAKGTTIDEETGETYDRFPSCVTTREDLRHNPPEILLTNPTMLEYILLRNKDNSLIEEGALRWIVIDETHTYTGAGAAELAMLLRRVMLAFGLSPREVRFATSSATIGNKMSPAEKDEAMRKFISGITGIHPDQLVVINGQMKDIPDVKSGKYAENWNRLFISAKNGNPYLPLNQLLPGYDTIIEKLHRLEEMCTEAPNSARIKVHYFFRVPNGGLFVRPSNLDGESFKVYTTNSPEALLLDDHESRCGHKPSPMLELSRCKKCGEFIAIGRGDTAKKTFGPIPMDDSDMFDLEQNVNKNGKNLIFGLSDGKIFPGDGNQGVLINGDHYNTSSDILDRSTGWEVVINTHNNCPYCGTKLTKSGNTEEERLDDEVQEEDSRKMQKFRVPVYKISQLMAPVVLNQLEENDKDTSIHRGQQYIGFVDSRQGAAQATLRQNLETERLWLYSTIYHALNHLAREKANIEKELAEIKKEMAIAFDDENDEKIDELSARRKVLQAKLKGEMTWTEIANLLYDDPKSDVLVKQFAKRTSDSEEFDEEGKVRPETKYKYVHAIMIEYLGKRPVHKASPETMGLFTTTYPQFKEVKKLPDAVVDFNKLIDDPKLHVSLDDWKDLMQVFLDYTVRSNESIFLKLSDTDPLDIFNCVRFATQKNRRRPAIKAKASKRSASRVVRYLAQLMVEDNQADTTGEVLDFASESIQAVVNALWNELIRIKLLQISTQFENGRHVQDPNFEKDGVKLPSYRLNVADISFKLYEKVVLADTMSIAGPRVIKRLRPVEVRFKDYSPYLRNNRKPVKITTEEEIWVPYPFETGESKETIEDWAKTNRKLLWDNQLWNEFGTFAKTLTDIHHAPEIFIQAEHTAQVDKIIARKVQDEFKKRRLNILACSTTMEMGVDLGSLELVMMSSVPPMPSNYKQRAGRSGRSLNRLKSVAITLCGSDSIGLRTLFDPIANIIDRLVSAPVVDLMSPQVVQRHVNAFLIRESGVFNMGDKGGNLSQRVLDFYTDLRTESEGNHYKVVDATGHEIIPVDEQNPETSHIIYRKDNPSIPYVRFNLFCKAIPSTGLQKRLDTLLQGTFFDGQQKSVITNALAANKQSRNEMLKKIDFAVNLDWKKLTDRQRDFFKLKFKEPLMMQLIGFWANTRFTPNANMPVNVVNYDVTSARQRHFTISTSNPSYDLRNALAQYVPGSSVVIDGRVSVVRGVRYHDFFAKKLVTFKTIYRNSERTVIDNKDEISKCIPWSVNGQEGLKMIQPTEFLPDITETENRILDSRKVTRVNAQLIGATKWITAATEPHLYSARSSRQTGNSEILYYNDGIGYGFCHCMECGKIVMEDAVATGTSTLESLPPEMNNKDSRNHENTNFHYMVGELDKHGKPIYCYGSRHPKSIQRNVVLADTILTDYTEIKIRYSGDQKWISDNSDKHEKLLTTLALVFTQAFAEYLGKEREAFGFAITPNGHICIFDTNPGGAGYSNQLAQIEVMTEVILASHDIIATAIARKSSDLLLDRYTIFLAHKIDLEAAYSWLSNEIKENKAIPEEVSAAIGSTSIESSLEKLEVAIREAQGSVVFFFTDNTKNWNYGNLETGWIGYHGSRFNNAGTLKICIVQDEDKNLPLPAIEMLRNFKAIGHKLMKTSNPYNSYGIYPVALVDGKLFITNNPDYATLNEYWGNGFLYSAGAKSKDFNFDALEFKADQSETTKLFKLDETTTEVIRSNELGKIIYDHANEIIDRFEQLCNDSDDMLIIEYQDEHMKSILAITVALQTIDWFVRKFNRPFTIRFNVESYFEKRYPHKSITKNLLDSGVRDRMLSTMTKRWLSSLDPYPYGTMLDSTSKEKGTLTHWRELSFRLGDTKLSIYPDGGFINGWNLKDHRLLTIDDMDASNPVGLFRKETIKFDVAIENS